MDRASRLCRYGSSRLGKVEPTAVKTRTHQIHYHILLLERTSPVDGSKYHGRSSLSRLAAYPSDHISIEVDVRHWTDVASLPFAEVATTRRCSLAIDTPCAENDAHLELRPISGPAVVEATGGKAGRGVWGSSSSAISRHCERPLSCPIEFLQHSLIWWLFCALPSTKLAEIRRA